MIGSERTPLEATGQEVAGGDLHAVHAPIKGVDVTWLYESSLLGVTRWHCCERGHAASADKQQHHFVLVFMHDGSFRLRGSRGSGLADLNSVLLLNPGEPYETWHPSGCGDHGSTIVPSPALMVELMARHAPQWLEREVPRLPVVTASVSSVAYLRERMLVRQLERAAGDVDPLAVEESALGVVDAVLRTGLAPRPQQAGGPRARARQSEQVETAVEVLHQRFGERLLLEEVSAAVGCSPYHLCRIFQREMRMPLHRYLNQLRLRSALERAAEPRTDLTELAFDSGFSSHSHFTAAFRREFGVPPVALRSALAGRQSTAKQGWMFAGLSGGAPRLG